uniref:Uncharacterized protein n=1 Tax=Helicotheca tamesis TaxID=374047 RepID=A0A7S2HYH1_9STRA|mmetsp:Transcript_4012/g.5428  ORF Transcript_4012/g.5428 Transcript_4012/m.5428 type:complete len:341 (+) Transcript_4012:42-1064(+)
MKVASLFTVAVAALGSRGCHCFTSPSPSTVPGRASSLSWGLRPLERPTHRDVTNLHLSDTTTTAETPPNGDQVEYTITEEATGQQKVGFFSNLTAKDINSFINTAVVIAVLVALLSKVASVDAGLTRGWTPEEVAARIPMDNWSSYSAVLEDAPISTKAITSASVYTIGDVIAQRTEGNSMGDLDRPRILRSLLAGLIGHGPLSHFWYDYSEAFFDDVLKWTEWWSFFPKVILDQTTWGPFWNNTYIILLGAMKLDKWENIWGDIKRTTIPLVVSGLKLWPLAHCVTYGLVPVENRLLWVDLVEIVWVTILATQASGGGAHGAHGSEATEVESSEASATS